MLQTLQSSIFWKTADLCDVHAENLQICEALFNDYGGQRSFQGVMATVRCFENNALVREALSEQGNGRVLVVDAGGSRRCAMLGDRLAALAVQNGWSGVVMYGCIRDSQDIAGMTLGVKALGTHPLKSFKQKNGEAGELVQFAGATFRPGEYLYADDDGIVVSPRLLKSEPRESPGGDGLGDAQSR